MAAEGGRGAAKEGGDRAIYGFEHRRGLCGVLAGVPDACTLGASEDFFRLGGANYACGTAINAPRVGRWGATGGSTQ